jgi:hypothetical protein
VQPVKLLGRSSEATICKQTLLPRSAQMMSTTRSRCDQFRMSRIRVLGPERKNCMDEDIICVGRFGLFGSGEGGMKIGKSCASGILLSRPLARP